METKSNETICGSASRSLFLAQRNDSVVEILLPFFFSTEFDGEFFEKEKKKNKIDFWGPTIFRTAKIYKY